MGSGRKKEHFDITVSQTKNFAKYHKEYYHKVLKCGRIKDSSQRLEKK